MKGFLRILAYLKNYKGYVALNLLTNSLFVLFNLLSLLLFIPFLDLLFSDQPDLVTSKPSFEWSRSYFEDMFSYYMSERIVEGGALEALSFICMVTLCMFFFKNVFRYLSYLSLAHIRQAISRDIRRDIYHRVIELPLGFFSDERKGDIMARNTSDVAEVDQSVIGSLEMMMRDPLNIIFSFSAMLLISPQLTLFSLLLMPLSGLIIGRISKSLKRTSRKGQDKQGELLSFLEESLGGLRIIKAFNAESVMRSSFSELNESLRRISRRLLNKRDLASPLSEFMGAMVMVGVIWYGGRLILGSNQGELTGSEFIGFIIIFSQSLRPIQSLAKTFSNINKGLASVERIDAIKLADNPIRDPEIAKDFEEFKSEIVYEGVEFGYAEQTVLHQLDLRIAKGQTIALVGESGGGKSTIADLLPRFYDVNSGSIKVDGVDIREYRVQDLRHQMGIVSQQAILFNDSIRNNIALGHDCSQEELERAAKIAHAHDFIMELPEGYETSVGDAGGKLSGGQRQRISIARAVLRNPSILILDEATSALDTESERLVQDALDNLMKDRTTLVIAHRLSTVQHADCIVVLQKGRVVESGTHEELMAREGPYRRLRNMQT